MKIKKYDNLETNESFWQDIKYGISKFGRYKAGSKIRGKKETTDKSNKEIEELLKVQSNKTLKEIVDVVKSEAPEFPNDRRRFTFLKAIVYYSQFYDSLKAATEKKPNEEGYLAPETANQLIESLRKVVKKHLDVDLKAVYSVMESKLTKREIDLINSDNPINEEEEIFKKLGQLKDKFMDRLFGAKSDQPEIVKSDRMATLQSNKLPLVLAGVGASLGALGWLAQTEWCKELIIRIFGDDYIKETSETVKTLVDGGKPDSKGMLHWMNQINAGEGLPEVRTGADVQSFVDKFGAENVSHMFDGNGGGSATSQIDLLQRTCGQNPTAGVGEIFTKANGMAGTMKLGQNLFGISKSAAFIGVKLVTTIKRELVKGAGKVIAIKVAGIGKIMTGIGIALVAAGVVTKLLREKGQRQSRAKNLNDLLQSLVLIKIDKNKAPVVPGIDPGEDKKIVSEEAIYPLMIKNLQSLKGILLNNDNVKLDGEKGTKSDIVKGRLYNYTNKRGLQKIVKVISVTHDTSIGKDKEWLTKDDQIKDILKSGSVSVIFPDKDGKYSSKSPEIAVDKLQLEPVSESILSFSELILEKDRLGKAANVEIGKNEDYLTQSTNNLRKSIKSLIDEKDKGISIDIKFIDSILEEKMDPETKQPVKDLFKEIYEYLYGNKSKTLSDLGVLYKENVKTISKASLRQVVAEKMARFAKRSMQFEGEGFYSGLGKLGDYLDEYNMSLKKIMDYYKIRVNESIITFENYKKK